MGARNFHTFIDSQVTWAAFAASRPYFGGRKNRYSEAQKAGLRYERRCQEYLCELMPEQYVASPWLMFRLKNEPYLKWCQPDGVRIDIERKCITIIEIKLRHMAEAYVQVTGIYAPVLRNIFEGWQLRYLEVTRYYDPMTYFPGAIQLVSNLDCVPTGRFGVHIWNP